MSRKTMYIVGNGPLASDLAGPINASDFVVRFNEPKASIGMSGTRTDILFLCNAGKPMERRLNDKTFVDSAIVRSAAQIILAYHPSIIRDYFPKPNVLSRLKGRRADWTMATIMALGMRGKATLVLPQSFYVEGCAELGVPQAQRGSVFPSTGYFGVYYILQKFDPRDWTIFLCGFNWAGWKRHSWADERGWITRKAGGGLIDIIA